MWWWARTQPTSSLLSDPAVVWKTGPSTSSSWLLTLPAPKLDGHQGACRAHQPQRPCGPPFSWRSASSSELGDVVRGAEVAGLLGAEAMAGLKQDAAGCIHAEACRRLAGSSRVAVASRPSSASVVR